MRKGPCLPATVIEPAATMSGRWKDKLKTERDDPVQRASGDHVIALYIDL